MALVTGGERRLGRAICIGLAEAGAHVVTNHRSDAASVAETATAVAAWGVRAITNAADFAVPHEVARMVAETAVEFGRVDICVNAPRYQYERRRAQRVKNTR